MLISHGKINKAKPNFYKSLGIKKHHCRQLKEILAHWQKPGLECNITHRQTKESRQEPKIMHKKTGSQDSKNKETDSQMAKFQKSQNKTNSLVLPRCKIVTVMKNVVDYCNYLNDLVITVKNLYHYSHYNYDGPKKND